MPIPPTFNDLKRSRNSYNFNKRNKIVSNIPPLPFTVPSLTVPNFTFNFLSIDNNYVATGDELGASDVDQLDFFNSNTPIKLPEVEFYSGYRLVSTTDYLFDSLYFINDKFKQKSIHFDNIFNSAGENTLRREFYNYSSEIKTQSFVLTSYDFNNLQVNLSTNITGFTGTTDDMSYTVQVSAVHENGRLLENFVNYRFQGDVNAPIASFNSLSTFNYVVPISKPFVDENYTLTLSTSRIDSVAGLYESTKSLNVNISAAPYLDALQNSIHTVWSTVSSLSNPLDDYETLSGVFLDNSLETKKSFYRDYQSGVRKLFYQQEFFRPDANLHYGDALDNATNEAIRTKYRYVNDRGSNNAAYNEAWFLYPYRDIYNLTGISLRGDNNITLINGKFGLSNTHFGGATNPGSIARFLTTENKIVSGTVVGELNLGKDANLIKLDNDITAEALSAGGTVKTYKLPLFNSKFNRIHLFPVLAQGGNFNLGKLRNPEFTGSFAYGEGDEFAALGSTYTPARETPPLSGYGTVFLSYNSLQSVSAVFENKKLGFPQRSLATGDSSSPNFIVHNNELLLMMTNLSTPFYFNDGPGGYEATGAGPAYTTKGFHDRIIDGMEALGREGYQLSAVQLD
jgi:hypothetical protein